MAIVVDFRQAVDRLLERAQEPVNEGCSRFGVMIYDQFTFCQDFETDSVDEAVTQLLQSQTDSDQNDWKAMLFEVLHELTDAIKEEQNEPMILYHIKALCVVMRILMPFDVTKEDQPKIRDMWLFLHEESEQVYRYYLNKSTLVVPRAQDFVARYAVTLQ